MAHFAELDQNNIVLRVIKVGNDVLSYNGDPAGETYCQKLFKSSNQWKQTSYNCTDGVYYTPTPNGGEMVPDADQSKLFRWTFAGIGMKYDADKDAFIEVQPYPSWTLGDDNQWHSPNEPSNWTNPDTNSVFAPVKRYWDEANQKWTAKGFNSLPADDTQATLDAMTETTYEWNGSAWVSI